MKSIQALAQFLMEGNKRAVEHVTTCEIDTATPQDATGHLAEFFMTRPRLNVYAYAKRGNTLPYPREGFMNVGEEILLYLLQDYNENPIEFSKQLKKAFNYDK